jgi:hypothetical protein
VFMGPCPQLVEKLSPQGGSHFRRRVGADHGRTGVLPTDEDSKESQTRGLSEAPPVEKPSRIQSPPPAPALLRVHGYNKPAVHSFVKARFGECE